MSRRRHLRWIWSHFSIHRSGVEEDDVGWRESSSMLIDHFFSAMLTVARFWSIGQTFAKTEKNCLVTIEKIEERSRTRSQEKHATSLSRAILRGDSLNLPGAPAGLYTHSSSTPAHSHNSFPSGIAVEPDEQQALTYLNRERKVFWAGICLFPSSYPARYFRNEGFSLTGKEIELPWQPRAQHPFIYIGFDVRLAKSFIRSENFFSSQNCVLGRYGTGCGFPIRNLEGQKNARWKYRNLPLPSIHWHAHSPPITHFFFTRLNWPFITSVPGVYLWLSLLLSFFIQKPNLRFDLLTRFGFHLHLLVDICHPFSVFLSVSGTLFRPLQYLRVVVFLPSDLFFTLSTKQISFLLVFNFHWVLNWCASFFPSSCLFWLFLLRSSLEFFSFLFSLSLSFF